MEKNLTINYTYYKNNDALNMIINHYKECDCCYFQIMDDGSTPPIDINIVPHDWSVYRINEDIGWNNEGARNILMETSKTEWNILIDMDFVIPLEDINKITEYIELLNTQKLYRFITDGHVSSHTINSFLITKNLFQKHQGYDRAFLGLYGNDMTLLADIQSTELLKTVHMKRILPEVHAINKEEHKKQFGKYLQHLIDKGVVYLDFPQDIKGMGCIRWVDSNVHQQHYKNFTWNKLQ